MGLAGTADNINAAFGVTLMDDENPKLGAFHARNEPVNLRSEVADAITGVFGLNNHRMLHLAFCSACYLGAGNGHAPSIVVCPDRARAAL